MTTPIRLSVQKDGHIILRIGEATVEVLAEGTLVVTAYLPTDTRPLVEYSSAPEPKRLPMPGPVFRLPEPTYDPPPTVKARKTPKRVKLGHEAPSGHTVHSYVLARIKPLVAPRSPEALAMRYAEYNTAMGTKHPIPGNLSLIDAFEHLKELVERWAVAKRNKAKSKRALIQQELFNGNARVTGSK